MKLIKVVNRAAILMLLLLSVFSAWAVPPALAQTATFSDVPSNYWAYAYIEAIYSAGITVGCSQSPLSYCPSDPVTRDQMAAFIIRALYGENFTCNGGANCSNTAPYFSDASPATEGSLFPYIQKLYELGITVGCSQSPLLYCPSDPVTRDQMAAFLVRGRQVKAGQDPASPPTSTTTSTPYFTDVPAANYYFTYVQYLKDNGITTGCGNGDYECTPDSTTDYVTRDQMAAFIARAFLANNVLSVTVNGSTCDPTLTTPLGYFNDPCVSVKVCTPGASTCRTINSILLDTGSFGLRIFKQALGNVSLTPVASGPGSLAECVAYADGSSDWGPVGRANVTLGNEPAVEVPIQVIDYTFPTIAAAGSVCPGSDQSPSDAGFNGILGVGPSVQDCGAGCVSSDNNGGNPTYYSCTGSTCTGTAVALTDQVTNPVTALPTDNNGIIVELPDVLSAGQPSVGGIVVFGIDTLFNNTPPAVTTYPLDQYGNFITTFNGVSYNDASNGGSFIDTGSNALYFPYSTRHQTSLQDCGGWFCTSTTSSNPYGITSLSAIIEGTSGSPSGTVQFQIGDFNALINSVNNNVYYDIGGVMSGAFDWGLPFYFGRNVFIGFEGRSSSGLGAGPYFAY